MLHTLVNASFPFFNPRNSSHLSAQGDVDASKERPTTNFERGSSPKGKSHASKARLGRFEPRQILNSRPSLRTYALNILLSQARIFETLCWLYPGAKSTIVAFRLDGPLLVLTNASYALATGEYLGCHSLSPIRLKRGVGDH